MNKRTSRRWSSLGLALALLLAALPPFVAAQPPPLRAAANRLSHLSAETGLIVPRLAGAQTHRVYATGAAEDCADTVTVQNGNDSGPGSLRQAIADVCDGGVIDFAGDYAIYLNSTLAITRPVTIDGSGRAITISGDSGNDGTRNVRVFSITANGPVTLTYLSVVSGGGIANYSGGGIYHDGGTLTVQSSALSGNDAYWGGGICNHGALTVTNSTLSGNSADIGGGGIYNDGTLMVRDSTLSGSWTFPVSAYGGGIYSSGTLTVQNSTLSGNSAEWGGGIYNNGTLNYANTIVANSIQGGDCVNEGTMGTNDHNLVEDGSCGTLYSGDPLLGPLADNGGATLTHLPQHGSPAIDAGNNASCLPTDQRGTPRPQDGDGNGDAVCDIGSVEVVIHRIFFLPILVRGTP